MSGLRADDVDHHLEEEWYPGKMIGLEKKEGDWYPGKMLGRKKSKYNDDDDLQCLVYPLIWENTDQLILALET
jgi:hypothetical protein